MIETSQTTDKLDAALAKAQAKMQHAKLDGKNPHFNSQYATLASALDAARSALAEAGISVTQWPIETATPGRVAVVTRLAHAGEWIRSIVSAQPEKQTPQGVGSAITYLRRYAYLAAVGAAPEGEEDDDGNAAGSRGNQGQQQGSRPPQGNQNQARREPAKPPQGKAAVKPPVPKGSAPGPRPKGHVTPNEDPSQPPPGAIELISEGQRKRLFALASEKGMTDDDQKAICAKFGITTRSAIPVAKYEALYRKYEEWTHG